MAPGIGIYVIEFVFVVLFLYAIAGARSKYPVIKNQKKKCIIAAVILVILMLISYSLFIK